MSAERQAVVRNIFSMWDIDGNGKVLIESFKDTTVDIGPTKSRVLDFLSVMDANSDGLLELDVRVRSTPPVAAMASYAVPYSHSSSRVAAAP